MITQQEYYQMLCKAAKDGTFPGVIKNQWNEYVCRYRGENGKRCAVGLIIPDDKYKESLEGSIVEDWWLEDGTVIPVENLTFEDYKSIQRYHDNMVGLGQGWNPDLFILKIGTLKCFESVVKE